MTPLPIDPLLPELVALLRAARRLVLRAEPGAGKTTRVPRALLEAGLAGQGEVVVLEPRRIAARAAAERVASERGEALGATVGYRVRLEQRGGSATRLWFLTEGVLSRQLARDPFLERIGVLVLDEFHERHLQSDLALAVARELQETVRPDLRLVVMSATLDTAVLGTWLGPDTAVVTAPGRAFPVAIDHLGPPADHSRPTAPAVQIGAEAAARSARSLGPRVAAALERVLGDRSDDGDVLVFLPGAAEIRRVAEAIGPIAARADLAVMPLHGMLPLADQRRVLSPNPRRRVILATNVAETSLTIDGVTTVIDSGLARIASLDGRVGIDRLTLTTIARSAAEQRTGRAGRTRPGRCLRLWSVADEAQRLERETPEIRRVDLTSAVLELRAWGLRDPARFSWLDAPAAGALARADGVLAMLGAITTDGELTEVGHRLLEMPAHPRLARVALAAAQQGVAAAGALRAALAGEREVRAANTSGGSVRFARTEAPAVECDLTERERGIEEARDRGLAPAALRDLGLDVAAVRRVLQVQERILRATSREPEASASRPPSRPAALRRALLAGFADRVARRRAPGSPYGVLVGGLGVVLAPESVVRDSELFLAIDLEAGGRERPEALVRMATAIDRDDLVAVVPHRLQRTSTLELTEAGDRVVERERLAYVDLVLAETTRTPSDRGAAGELLGAAVRATPARLLTNDRAAERWLARLTFLHRAMADADLPDPQALLGEAAAELCRGRTALAEVPHGALAAGLQALLTYTQRSRLEREAPDRFLLPTGRLVEIEYEPGATPRAAARIQELFGLKATPRLAGGRVALVIDLLSPAHRPVQRTDDLASFWRSGYAEVRKQLRGRYPKHFWPEDPRDAPPTTRPGKPRIA